MNSSKADGNVSEFIKGYATKKGKKIIEGIREGLKTASSKSRFHAGHDPGSPVFYPDSALGFKIFEPVSGQKKCPSHDPVPQTLFSQC